MDEPFYLSYDEEDLNRDVLVGDQDFINDASEFLLRRSNLNEEELFDNDAIYDAFLEHFRFQTINEVTAIKDLMYAQDASEEEKARMLRLMDTYDRVDNEYNLGMVGDYAAGIITAPSTYASLLSFGAGSVGAQAAKAGVKYGIREALRAGLRTAAGSAAVEGAVGAGQAAVIEQTRVEIDPEKESIDPTRVALGGAVSATVGGVLGGATGALKGLDGFKEETLFRSAKDNLLRPITEGNEIVQKIKSTAPKNSKNKKLVDSAEEIAKKVELDKTIPDILGYGRELRSGVNTPTAIQGRAEIDMLSENVSMAAAELLQNVKPLSKERLTELGLESADQERITSKLARSLYEGSTSAKSVQETLDKYGISQEHLGALFAAEVSAAGRTLGQVGAAQRSLKTITEAVDSISGSGAISESALSAAKQEAKKLHDSAFKRNLEGLSKLRVGIMTTQIATTVRNTTGGFMRNYVYALDNLGTGATSYVYGKGKQLLASTDADKAAADAAVRLGQARLKNSATSLLPFDFLIGTASAEARALKRIMADPAFGKNQMIGKLFRDLADLGENASGDSPLVKLAVWGNYFNRMSDNMFKRAIFARELDVRLKEAGQGSLKEMFASGNFRSINDDAIKKSMDTAMAFTYQKSFDKYKGGAFDKLAGGFIDLMSTPLGSLFVPFPRYMANAFKFGWDHTPILGLIDLNKGLKPVELRERIGRQIAALGVFGAMYALRADSGSDGYTPYQYRDPTSATGMIDAAAALGPFSIPALAADWLYARYNNADDMVKAITTEEILGALTGGQYRNNQTIVDFVDLFLSAVQGAGDERDENLILEAGVRFTGNTVSAFTVPAGMIRDVVASFDEEYRTVPDNTDVDFFKYFLLQSTKSFPRAVGQEDVFGIETRPLLQPTRADPIKRRNPIVSQITGLGFRDAPTLAETEFERLGINWTQYAPKNIKGDSSDSARDLTNKIRGEMGKLVEFELTQYMETERYQNMTDSQKITALTDSSRGLLPQLKERAKDRVSRIEMIRDHRIDRETRNDVARDLFFSLPSAYRKTLVEAFNNDDYIRKTYDSDKVGEEGYANYIDIMVFETYKGDSLRKALTFE